MYFTGGVRMLRVFEAFAGVGSQRMALQNIGIEHEVVAISEIDKFAIASYEAIHGKVNNLGDISKLEEKDIPDHDLFTYSFPCQDISLAGKQGGFEKGSGTRSSLLWECNRVIESKRPKYLLLENVKNLVGKKFKPDFDEWLNHLESLGYKNYWQVLNAKDYGIPQNRERVFVVSILGEHEPYKFPEKQELKLRLKDVLESEVDEKFYLSEEQTNRLSNNSFNQANKRLQEKEYSDTLLARDYKDPKVVRVGGVFDKGNKRSQAGGIYDKEQLSPTLTTITMEGGLRQPSVLIKNATKKGYLEATHGDGVDLAYPESKTRRGRVQEGLSQTLDTGDSKGVVIAASRGRNPENPSDRTVGSPTEQRLEINNKGVSNTLTTVQKDNYVLEGVDVHPFSKKLEFRGYRQKEVSPCLLATDYKAPKTILQSGFRIRKLTPLECWRLMGFKDLHFYKAQEVNSNSQLYKQAGNSIVVQVLEAIFKVLLKESNK